MRSLRVGICAILFLTVGCGTDSVPVTTGAVPSGVTVRPGQSIQAAVDAAAPGDTITVLPGDYIETHSGTAAVWIDKPLKLIARSERPNTRVRIQPGPGQRDGIVIAPRNQGDPDIDGVEVRGFTVEGFKNNGIWLRHVQNFTIEDNESIDNLEVGIWPTLSANGLVKKNVSYGSQDASLWVEASENVRVIENDLHHSPTGLEITISNEVLAQQNDVYNNTIGIGLYHPAGAGLPPLEPPSRNGFWHILDNRVYDNNEPNSAEGGQAGALPPGGGILLLGVDNVDVQRNHVENNDFFGIAMMDYCLAVEGTDFDCRVHRPDFRDTSPDNNKFIDNTVINNAANPPPGPFQGVAADMLGLGGKNNCASGNTTGTISFLPELPECL